MASASNVVTLPVPAGGSTVTTVSIPLDDLDRAAEVLQRLQVTTELAQAVLRRRGSFFTDDQVRHGVEQVFTALRNLNG